MNESKLLVVFSGDAVKTGEINAQIFGKSLQTLHDLFRVANETLNENHKNSDIVVRLQETRKGSFEFALVLQHTHEANSLLQYVSADGMVDSLFGVTKVAKDVGTAIVAGGLFELLKLLYGRKPTVNNKVDIHGNVTINVGGEEYKAHKNTYKLLTDNPVRKETENLVKLLDEDSFDSISFKKSSKSELKITKKEIKNFRNNIETYVDPTGTTKNIELTLKIVRMSFNKDHTWSLKEILTDKQYNKVKIYDEKFLADIEENKISFSSQTRLVCDVQITTEKNNSGKSETTYAIKKVKRCDQNPPPAEQSSF